MRDFRDVLKKIIDRPVKMYTLEKNSPITLRQGQSKEALMLSITEKADEMIQKFFQEKPGDHVIRIYQVQGG
jgi:hypothetical protein